MWDTSSWLVDDFIVLLSGWFDGKHDISKAYNFFAPNYGNWPWKLLLVWKNCLIPKHKFYAWLFAHWKVLTRDRQHNVVEKKCVLCDAYNKCFDNLFFWYHCSNSLPTKIGEWLGMKKLMGSHQALLKAFRWIYRGTSSLAKMRYIAMAAVIFTFELQEIEGFLRMKNR